MGCVYSSKSVERSSSNFGKLLGEIEFEFLRNSKYLVELEDRAGSRKKRLGEAEASPSIHVLIHRSLVSPTALSLIAFFRRMTGNSRVFFPFLSKIGPFRTRSHFLFNVPAPQIITNISSSYIVRNPHRIHHLMLLAFNLKDA